MRGGPTKSYESYGNHLLGLRKVQTASIPYTTNLDLYGFT